MLSPQSQPQRQQQSPYNAHTSQNNAVLLNSPQQTYTPLSMGVMSNESPPHTGDLPASPSSDGHVRMRSVSEVQSGVGMGLPEDRRVGVPLIEIGVILIWCLYSRRLNPPRLSSLRVKVHLGARRSGIGIAYQRRLRRRVLSHIAM
jgi:hypothetical protein